MKLPAIRKASKNDEFHRNITPGFILERKMVNYDHLPRSCTGSRPDGSLADRIGWVITHPDLHAQVLRRTRDIPNAAYNIRLYRHLTEAAPCLARLATHTRRAGAPKPEKLAAQAAADSAYQHLITAAKSVIEVLATGHMAGCHDRTPGTLLFPFLIVLCLSLSRAQPRSRARFPLLFS